MSGIYRSFILFDDSQRDHLIPFTFIRPMADLRIGILTIRQKWERWTGQSFSYLTQDYLREKFPCVEGEENVVISGSVTPNRLLVDEVLALRCGEALMAGPVFIAGCFDREALAGFNGDVPDHFVRKQFQTEYRRISKLWNIFRMNGEELLEDFNLLTAGRESAPVSNTNNIIHPGAVFVEEGAVLEYTTINAATGPVYICKGATIMEGAMIRGPFSLGEGATVKMGARIYGPTTIGPYSKIGGEVTNSVIIGYSNKVHDGYMGNSVLGEWCNIGAGSNTSNLKNNYALVTLWNYALGKSEETGLQFCGLFMGDYSRCGINTMFNTGTVVGISANIFGSGYPGSFVPSFSWGGAPGFETYRLPQALDTIQTAKGLFNLELGETEKKIINRVFMLTGRYRNAV